MPAGEQAVPSYFEGRPCPKTQPRNKRLSSLPSFRRHRCLAWRTLALRALNAPYASQCNVRPQVAHNYPKSSGSCPSSVRIQSTSARFDLFCADFGCFSTEAAPRLVELRPNALELSPHLKDSGSTLAEVGRRRPQIFRTQPNVFQFGRLRANIGRTWLNSDQNRPNSTQIRPVEVQSCPRNWSKLVRVRPASAASSAQFWPKLGPESTKFGPSSRQSARPSSRNADWLDKAVRPSSLRLAPRGQTVCHRQVRPTSERSCGQSLPTGCMHLFVCPARCEVLGPNVAKVLQQLHRSGPNLGSVGPLSVQIRHRQIWKATESKGTMEAIRGAAEHGSKATCAQGVTSLPTSASTLGAGVRRGPGWQKSVSPPWVGRWRL